MPDVRSKEENGDIKQINKSCLWFPPWKGGETDIMVILSSKSQNLITKITKMYHEKCKTEWFPSSNHGPNYFNCFILWSCYINVNSLIMGQKPPCTLAVTSSESEADITPPKPGFFSLTSQLWLRRHTSETQEVPLTFPRHEVVLGSQSSSFSLCVHCQVI